MRSKYYLLLMLCFILSGFEEIVSQEILVQKIGTEEYIIRKMEAGGLFIDNSKNIPYSELTNIEKFGYVDLSKDFTSDIKSFIPNNKWEFLINGKERMVVNLFVDNVGNIASVSVLISNAFFSLDEKDKNKITLEDINKIEQGLKKHKVIVKPFNPIKKQYVLISNPIRF